MRDKVLIYALVASIAVHVGILCVAGTTSAAKPIDVEGMKLVRVDVVKLPDEVPAAPDEAPKPKPKPADTVKEPSIPPPEEIPVAKPKPKPVPPRPDRKPLEKPLEATKPGNTNSTRLPGNPGSALNLGSGSPNGTDLGPTGSTPPGWVPGTGEGPGKGSGTGPGVGKPEPVPGAADGPGEEPAPLPRDVDIKVCAVSNMLPGKNCEKVVVKTFDLDKQPRSTCTVCKPKHVSTLADRSEPEFISGKKRPDYPSSARNSGTEGTVKLEYTINTEGNATGVKVISSSGSRDLDQAAIDAVQSRKYKPAVQGGIARNFKKRETFTFKLD